MAEARVPVLSDEKRGLQLNEDLTPVDVRLFQQALQADSRRLKQLKQDERMAKRVLGSDLDDAKARTAAIQELAKQAQNKNEMDSIEKLTSIERMRCSCTVPRDPSNLYKEMDKAGLSYGPSFRLLTEVFIPEEVSDELDLD